MGNPEPLNNLREIEGREHRSRQQPIGAPGFWLFGYVPSEDMEQASVCAVPIICFFFDPLKGQVVPHTAHQPQRFVGLLVLHEQEFDPAMKAELCMGVMNRNRLERLAQEAFWTDRPRIESPQ